MVRNRRIVSASFDVFPAPKGAATHIEAFVRALATNYGGLDLLTVENPDPAWQSQAEALLRILEQEGVRHHAMSCHGPDMIARALMFSHQITRWLRHRGRVDVIHVRSIFEGFAIAKSKEQVCKYLVYECNGLPSIELKYHYAKVAEDDELLEKLRFQEKYCLKAADLVITPSDVTGDYLQSLGVPAERIRIIPNGVDLDTFTPRPPQIDLGAELRLLYCGTLTVWQGVHYALEALRLYLRDAPASLTLVGPMKKRHRRKLLDHIADLGLSKQVNLLEPVPKSVLNQLHHQSDVVLVPLPHNDRNVVQGCCPLKFLEAMATGTPVVVSDLPVTRSLVTSEEQARFVRPNSAKAIKDALFELRDDPELRQRLSRNASKNIQENFRWIQSEKLLIEAYEEMFRRGVNYESASTTF